jgi:PAS domain S-box-containing protein
MATSGSESEYRVLVLMPTAKDATRTCELLAEAGLFGAACPNVEAVCRELVSNAGVVLLTDDAVAGDGAERLAAALGDQPAWSDVPLVILTHERPDAQHDTFRESANVTLVERPVRIRTLLSVVRSAMRARRRQYEVRDLIGERQRSEEILRLERERLRITLSSIGDGVISTDVEGRVMYLNGVAETLTGWPLIEATGRLLSETFRIVNEHTRQPADDPVARTLREGRVVGLSNHTVLIARDGIERPIDDSAAPMRDRSGSPVGAVMVFRDVSERKHADEALARLAAIVETSDDAIVSKTLDGVIRTWNAGAERVFGYTPTEAVGRPITLIIPQELLDEEREILARLRLGERVDHFETIRVAKDGRRLDISLTVSPLRDPEGRVVGASKIARDITERKKMEVALREADRKKDDFIALLAHELRNPLAPVRNGLQVIRLSSDRGTRDRSLEMMDRQLTHMVRLIDDLLDVSRISRNKMELRRTRIFLADAVSSAVETARPAIDNAGHELIVDLPTEPVLLDADLTRLAQVFANLLTNSARYTEQGGRIVLTGRREGTDVVVSVSDTGIGIPAEALPHVFDMFSQVDRSIERSSGGLGIGLALVKGLVEMHGGTVLAASGGKDRGSKFTVCLPTIPIRTTSEVPAGPSGDLSGSCRRILVADDNRDSADSMAEMLRLLGNVVDVAHDGVETVERATSFRPEVILMDVGMPRLNGLDATRWIREQPWGGEVTILALTGWGQDNDRTRSKAAGCDGHLVKPVSLSDLQRLLSELAKT